MNNRPSVQLMIALPCEAKPLIAHFRLKRRMSVDSFAVYEKDHIRLTVSGLGKVAMAAGVALSHQLFGAKPDTVWLNVGIAGHRDHPLGSAFIAHQITDADTGKRWYPPSPFKAPCKSEKLHTVSVPKVGYPDSCLYDMEASAFYDIATRFSTGELVQCLKIVSDNNAAPAGNVSPQNASAAIAAHLQMIDAFLHKQQRLAEILTLHQPEWVSRTCGLWRFTHNETIQLKEISRRWEILAADNPPKLDGLSKTHNAKQVLAFLKKEVEALQLRVNFT